MATVVVSVNAGAGGGLATDEHLLESEESVSLTRNVDTYYQEVYDENSDTFVTTIGVDIYFSYNNNNFDIQPNSRQLSR